MSNKIIMIEKKNYVSILQKDTAYKFLLNTIGRIVRPALNDVSKQTIVITLPIEMTALTKLMHDRFSNENWWRHVAFVYQSHVSVLENYRPNEFHVLLGDLFEVDPEQLKNDFSEFHFFLGDSLDQQKYMDHFGKSQNFREVQNIMVKMSSDLKLRYAVVAKNNVIDFTPKKPVRVVEKEDFGFEVNEVYYDYPKTAFRGRNRSYARR